MLGLICFSKKVECQGKCICLEFKHYSAGNVQSANTFTSFTLFGTFFKVHESRQGGSGVQNLFTVVFTVHDSDWHTYAKHRNCEGHMSRGQLSTYSKSVVLKQEAQEGIAFLH